MKMRLSCLSLWVCLCLALAAPVTAQQQEAPVYTFVAEWTVDRPQWANFTAHFEKNNRPVLERLTSDGTLEGWGAYENVVHTPDGPTHGVFFISRTMAGIEKARLELIKLPVSPAQATAKHRDFYVRSLIHRSKTAAKSATGYLSVSATVLQPGKGTQWRELWDKNTQPILDPLLADGSILSYSIEVEQIHTDNPGLRYVVYIASSVEAEDKVNAAFAAANEKRSAEERRAIAAANAEVVVPGSHRDFFARIIAYSHK